MSTPVSFTIRPPSAAALATAPARPSPLGRHSSSHRGPPSRRLFEQGGDDDDEDDEEHAAKERVPAQRETAFSGFGNGAQESVLPCDEAALLTPAFIRASSSSRKETLLVIPSLPNRDWRQSSLSQNRNRPSYVPESQPKVEASDPSLDRINDGPQRRGLRLASPKQEVQVKTEPGEHYGNGDSNGFSHGDQSTKEEEDVKPKMEELSLDQQALNALLSGSPPPDETDEERAQRELVIQMHRDREMKDGRIGGNLETDAFRQDLASRPDEVGHAQNPNLNRSLFFQSTLDDYAAVPIAAFGTALLRGMGYDPSNDTEIHIPKARPALLGIGATPLQTSLPPEGSASGKSKGKTSRPPKVDYAKRGGRGYMPVIQREKSSTPLAITGGDSSRRTSPGTGTESDASGRRRRRDIDDVDGTDGSERERASSRRRDDRGDSDRERDRASSRRHDRSRRDDRESSRRDDRDHDRDRDRVRSSRDDRERSSRGDRERSSRDDSDRQNDADRGRDDKDYPGERRRRDDGDRYRERERDRR